MDTSYDPSSLFSTGGGLVGYALLVIGLWPTLVKAGLPGWGALIPLYNLYLICKLAGVSGFYVLLLFVPLIDLFVVIWLAFRVSSAFGHGFLMAFFGLFLFSPIGFWVIGYGGSTYRLARYDAT
jgi:hypothetical protein